MVAAAATHNIGGHVLRRAVSLVGSTGSIGGRADGGITSLDSSGRGAISRRDKNELWSAQTVRRRQPSRGQAAAVARIPTNCTA